jgi:Cu(I)/Ag(I) efflux system membrane fusion protein
MMTRIARLGLIVAALVAAWFFTRASAVTPARTAGHQHGTAPASDSARPVQLSDRDQRRIGVTFAPVRMGALDRNVRVVAQVAYDETRIVTVAPRVEGWVDRLFVDFNGQQVKAGDPLLRVYSPMVVAAAEELLLARKLVTDVAGSTAEARQNAEQLLASSRRRLDSWSVSEADIRRIEETGEAPHAITLRAPISGVVVEKNVLSGQRIMEGVPLYRIADLSVVWLEGEVFEQDLSTARVGQEVKAEFQALPGEVRTGRITYVYPTLSAETRTGRIRVALANPGQTLRPGMFATIRFSAPVGRAGLSVPRSAVLSTGERNLVFLKRPDGRFTPTDVVLGVQTEDQIQILKGLVMGDTVVASATFLVDAESNLGTLLGGMGDMPGMDMTAPGARIAPTHPDSAHDSMADMPGMEMPAKPKARSDSGHTGRRE